MNSSLKKIQAILCLIAGVGLFFPLVTATIYGESSSVSFMTGFDISKIIDGGVFNSKLILGIVIVSFIMLIVREFSNDSFSMKMMSFIFILASGILFYINVDKLNTVKSLLSSTIKYGIGYYMSLISFIAAIVLGLIDIFNGHGTYESMNDNTFDMLKNSNTNDVKVAYDMLNNNQVSNNIVSQNQNVPPTNDVSLQNQTKLADLVNHNQTSEQQSSTDSMNK